MLRRPIPAGHPGTPERGWRPPPGPDGGAGGGGGSSAAVVAAELPPARRRRLVAAQEVLAALPLAAEAAALPDAGISREKSTW